MPTKLLLISSTVMLQVVASAVLYAQTLMATTVTYQGQLLQDGVPVNGQAGMVFHLFDAPDGGAEVAAVTISSVDITAGLFTVELDFGTGAFDGETRWLEIEVEFPAGAENWTTLSPRQELTPAPYALVAAETIGVDGHSLDARDGSPTNRVYVDDSGRIRLGYAGGGVSRMVNIHGGLDIFDDDGAGTSEGIIVTSNQFEFRELTGETPIWDYFRSTDTHRFYTGDQTLRLTITSEGNIGIGTDSPNHPLHVEGSGSRTVYAENDSASGAAFEARATGGGSAVRAYSTSTGSGGYGLNAYAAAPDARAIYAFNEAESGAAYAIYGENVSPDGIAIFGYAENDDDDSASIGVYGRSNSEDGAGVYGEATHTIGGAYGVRGVSDHGTGVQGENLDYGNVGALGRHFEGVYGESDYGLSGIGVHGKWTGAFPGYGYGGAFTTTSHLAAGVLGRNDAEEEGGIGVIGIATFSDSGESFGGYFEAASSEGHAVHGVADGNFGRGVYGTASGRFARGVAGVADGADGRGVYGASAGNDGMAVSGEATGDAGVGGSFTAAGAAGRAVYAVASHSGADVHYGGFFQSNGDNGRGVYGVTGGDDARSLMGEANGRRGIGVYGTADGVNGMGVYGAATDNTDGLHYGGYFESAGDGHALYATTESAAGRAIFAENLSTAETEHYAGYFRATGNYARAVYGLVDETGSGSEMTFGGYFESRSSSGVGVYGVTTSPYYSGAGVLGVAFGEGSAGIKGIDAGFGFAGWFEGPVYTDGDMKVGGGIRLEGDLDAAGTISKGAGSFRIDHPLDPENKYLYHSFVESPDMMNVYNGNVVADERGCATVELPEWFEALNRDFRYQLTCIGGFAPVYVAEEIHGNRFRIAGAAPGMKVSWQITGIRQDPFAEANRIPVETDKPAEERGTYLHPQAWGQPPELQVGRVLEARAAAARARAAADRVAESGEGE